jgi:hypothetical protein
MKKIKSEKNSNLPKKKRTSSKNSLVRPLTLIDAEMASLANTREHKFEIHQIITGSYMESSFTWTFLEDVRETSEVRDV